MASFGLLRDMLAETSQEGGSMERVVHQSDKLLTDRTIIPSGATVSYRFDKHQAVEKLFRSTRSASATTYQN